MLLSWFLHVLVSFPKRKLILFIFDIPDFTPRKNRARLGGNNDLLLTHDTEDLNFWNRKIVTFQLQLYDENLQTPSSTDQNIQN